MNGNIESDNSTNQKKVGMFDLDYDKDNMCDETMTKPIDRKDLVEINERHASRQGIVVED